MTLEIDMRDPDVQRLLGGPRQLVQLAGDAPDPTGHGPNGAQVTYHLNQSAIAHPLVIYKHSLEEYLLECDVYQHPGEPPIVHLICPRCHNALNIRAGQKDIQLELGVGPAQQGRLSIESFECTWERADAGQHVPGAITSGTTLCRWRVAIENNVAKDA